MSNPSKAPREGITTLGNAVPDCHFLYMSEAPKEGQKLSDWQKELKAAKAVETSVALLAELDMVVEEPFTIPIDYTVDKQARNQEGPFYAMAKRGGVSTRPRTGVARDLVQKIYDLVPEPERPDVEAKMRTIALADAGTEFTLGRLQQYYPRRGSTVAEPITRKEAALAWEQELGLLLTDPTHTSVYVGEDELRTLPFSRVGEADSVRVNLKAGNGFPVMGKGDDPEAQKLYLGLAQQVRTELEAAYVRDPDYGVRDWLRKAERDRPWLVVLQGKCKADYYTGVKVRAKGMRFYNVLGRQMSLNMQSMFQVVENLAQSVLESDIACSVSGASFTKGGAARMVAEMSRRLHATGSCHVRMGDDSWVCILEETNDGTLLHMCALDCSAFDLTQHNEATYHIHARLKEIASLVDPVIAALQYEYFRERVVVTVRRDVRRWKHGGASGLPGQSKVNGAIMGTVIERVLRVVDAKLLRGDPVLPITEDRLNAIIALVGQRLGLTIRVEQYACENVSNPRFAGREIEAALRSNRFLFMGYNFYANSDLRVSVFADMPRALSRMRYPNLTYVADREDLEALEAARLASVLGSMGMPPPEWLPAFQAGVTQGIALLQRVLSNPKMVERTEARVMEVLYLTAAAEQTVPPPSTYEGLLRVLSGGFAAIWATGPTPEELASDNEAANGRLRDVRAWRFDASVKTLVVSRESMRLATLRVPSRAPTEKTAGRNPNTKVFGPAKAPRPKFFELRRVAPNAVSQMYSYAEGGDDALLTMAVEDAFEYMSAHSVDERSTWGSEADSEESDRSVYASAPYRDEDRYLDDDAVEEFLDVLRWGPGGATGGS